MSTGDASAIGGEVEEKAATPAEIGGTALDRENKPDDHADMYRMGKKQDFKVGTHSPWQVDNH